MLGNRSSKFMAGVAGAAVGLSLVGAGPAFAAASRQSEHLSDDTSEASSNPCTDVPGTWATHAEIDRYALTTANGVRYYISITGTASFTPDATAEPSYSGTFSLRYGENDHGSASTSTQTTQVRLTGTDGSTISVVEHAFSLDNGHVTVDLDTSTVHCG